MAPSINRQLEKQGVRGVPLGVYGVWQLDTEAVTQLKLRGVITDSEARKAHKRLMGQILQWLSANSKTVQR